MLPETLWEAPYWQQSWQRHQHWPAKQGGWTSVGPKRWRKKRDCNIPCLLLRWSQCLLCWCSFLRWQEDLGGKQRRNCCDKKKWEKCRSIDVCKVNWKVKCSHFTKIFKIYVDHRMRVICTSRTEGLCVPAVWMMMPGHQSLEGQQTSSRTVICPYMNPWQHDLHQAAHVLVSTQTLSTRAIWGLWRHWCFWLKLPVSQTWIHSSTRETSCIVVSTAVMAAPPTQTVQQLTDVLIQGWEEIPLEISRLIRSVPRRKEHVQAVRRPHTPLSYIMSGLDWIHRRFISDHIFPLWLWFSSHFNDMFCKRFMRIIHFHRLPITVNKKPVVRIKYTILHLCYFSNKSFHFSPYWLLIEGHFVFCSFFLSNGAHLACFYFYFCHINHNDSNMSNVIQNCFSYNKHFSCPTYPLWMFPMCESFSLKLMKILEDL